MVIKPDGSAELMNQEFERGEGMALHRNVAWKLKRERFFVHHTNQYYVLHDGELLGLVPYVSYGFSFPVMVPQWGGVMVVHPDGEIEDLDRKSTRLNSSHANISYAVFCLKKK